MTNRLQNIRSRERKFETFRTPFQHYESLLKYAPQWFEGRGLDPSAGDGRMIRRIIERGNRNAHVVGDIRPEERANWKDLKGCSEFIGDYLEYKPKSRFDFLITNPPFTLAQAFVEKAIQEVRGPICILQSVAFQGTQKRSEWLKWDSGLRYVLNLSTRPKWEVASGEKPPSNVWDFAWFVFDPNYIGLPEMDWLL